MDCEIWKCYKTVAIKTTSIVQHFKNTPDLKVNSEKYPFKNFVFSAENIDKSNFIFPKDSVLGLQAEACFEAYLKQSKNFELLAANLQIHGEKHTLGELDYIVRNLQTDEVLHIELACKFYLYDENAGESEEQKWIGPNRKDSLYEKLEKVKHKQFPLLQTSETSNLLASLGIPKPTSQELCLKAFLFLPKELSAETFPKHIKECIVGHYLKPEDLVENVDVHYAIPSKKEWLLPINLITQWYSFSEIKPLIDAQLRLKKSPLIYKKTPHKLERFFVVWW